MAQLTLEVASRPEGTEAEAAPVEAHPTERWRATDWKIAALLAGIPAVVLATAAATGYPLLTGDDVAQNFPLEELSGRILASGHLPLWDGYLWGGTPLLGGANAHSLLPITLLFAVLPPLAAWVLGEVLVIAAAAVGTQLFLRRTGCSSLAAGLGGATFGLGGYFSSQLVHIDFAAAAAALPWALVALHGLAARPAASRARHALLLAAAVAWLCLAGSPDIVIDAVLALGGYLVHLLAQPRSAGRRGVGRLGLLAWSAAGALGGLCLGALQWLPAAYFISVSQRAHASYAFISGGSLDGGNFLELLVPHVLGGGSLGVRAFAGTFPLAEVNAYPGTLALVAVFVMAAALRRRDAWRWRVWVVMTALSLVVVSGRHTPFEHLLAALPLTGSERLPNRALILLALSAALLLGYFVDELLARRPSRTEMAVASLPLLGIFAVTLGTILSSRPAGGWLTAHGSGWSVAGVLPYLAVSCALALGAGALVFFGWRLGPARLALAVAALVIVDLAVSAANQSSLAPVYSSALSPSHAPQVAALAAGWRYLVVDPSLSNGLGLDSIGGSDLGVVRGLASAGGYGSLEWGPYETATGTHTQDGALPAALSNGTFSAMGLKALLTVPSELVRPETAAAPASTIGIPVSGRATLWFGQPLSVGSASFGITSRDAAGRAVTVPGGAASATAAATSAPYVQLVGSSGRALTGARRLLPRQGAVSVTFGTAPAAYGIEIVAAPADELQVTTPRVTAADPLRRLSLSGPLEAAVSGAGWVEVGDVGGYSAFRNDDAARPLRVVAGGATLSATTSALTGATVVHVTSPVASQLIRSVSDVPGWRAWVRHGASTTEVTVERHGLSQEVPIPAGTSTVTFAYVPPGWTGAQLLAVAGLLICLCLVALEVRGRRRQRRAREHQATSD